MVACEAVLAAGIRPRGLLVLSGALIARERWQRLARDAAPNIPSPAGLSVFQSHGTTDPVLPVETGKALGDLLDDAGAIRAWLEFDGGHGIPPGVVDAASAWISKVFS